MNTRRIRCLLLWGLIILLVVAACIWMIPFLKQFEDVESSTTVQALTDFKAYTDGLGIWKYPLLLFLQVLQIVVAIIPGGPMQILMGFVLGTSRGMVVSLLGIVIATYLIIFLIERYGMRFIRLFVDPKKFDALRFLQQPVKRDLLLFVLFLIPGSPKDLLTFFAPLTGIRKNHLVLLVSCARIPSLFWSIYLGATLSKGDLKLSLLLFSLIAILGIFGIILYNAILKKHQKGEYNENL